MKTTPMFFKLEDGDILNINDIMSASLISKDERNDYYCRFRMRTYNPKYDWDIFGTESDYNRFCAICNA